MKLPRVLVCLSLFTASCAAPDLPAEPASAPAAATTTEAPPAAADGWALLSDAERAMLTALIEGEANPWSTAARPIVRKQRSAPGWSEMTATKQAAFYRSLWENDAVRPLQASFLQLLSGRTAETFTLATPTSVGVVSFAGGTGAASRSDMTISGNVVSIYAPDAPSSDGTLFTTDEIAVVVAKLPAVPRRQLLNVVLNPFRNPNDVEYDEKFGVMGFRSFMEGRATGRVTVFPQVRERPDATDVLLHETGHVWSLRDFTDQDWAAWDAAAKADGHFVSTYASTLATEDVAETYAVYASLVPGAAWDEVQAMFPARFAILGRKAPH